jgi:hypothetical protein
MSVKKVKFSLLKKERGWYPSSQSTQEITLSLSEPKTNFDFL